MPTPKPTKMLTTIPLPATGWCDSCMRAWAPGMVAVDVARRATVCGECIKEAGQMVEAAERGEIYWRNTPDEGRR